MSISSVISVLGEWLYSLNPSLPPLPPAQVGDDSDVCFLGPNGEDAQDLVTLCGALPKGMRPNVGSWYLHPDRHVAESLVVILVCFLYIYKVPIYSQTTRTNKTIHHPFWVKPLTIFCCTMIGIYKSMGFNQKWYYLVMPCNVKWMMYLLLCFGPTQFQHVTLELLLSYTGLALVAVVTPDTEDTVLPGELYFFFFNHIVLLLLPFAYIANGSISTKDYSLSTHGLWVLLAMSWFSILYTPIVTVLAVISGLNLNYMLHPPPDQTLCEGDNYRLHSCLCCAVMFSLWRGLMCLSERWLAPTTTTTSTTTNGKKQA
jgi:hypothetical protein